MSTADDAFYSPNHTLPTPAPVPRPGERLRRVRKDQRTVEAHLRYHPDGLCGGVDVQFYYRGEFMCGRRAGPSTPAKQLREAFPWTRRLDI